LSKHRIEWAFKRYNQGKNGVDLHGSTDLSGR
jgi:hypothetical protein